VNESPETEQFSPFSYDTFESALCFSKTMGSLRLAGRIPLAKMSPILFLILHYRSWLRGEVELGHNMFSLFTPFQMTNLGQVLP
jgi:hypothetical protein